MAVFRSVHVVHGILADRRIILIDLLVALQITWIGNVMLPGAGSCPSTPLVCRVVWFRSRSSWSLAPSPVLRGWSQSEASLLVSPFFSLRVLTSPGIRI